MKWANIPKLIRMKDDLVAMFINRLERVDGRDEKKHFHPEGIPD